MFKKKILAFVCIILLWQAYGLFNTVQAQSVERLDQTESVWLQIWYWLNDHRFIFSLIIVALLTIFSGVMAMLKRDKLLKSLAGQFITIEMRKDHNNQRYRGRLRVEAKGLEVLAEMVNEGNEKVSYLMSKEEYKNIHALVRYHDFLTDREKEAREVELDMVYHPSIGMRLKRRARNIVNEMRRVATEAFTMIFGKIKASLGAVEKHTTEMESTGKEAIEYATAASYDALIDRLIGTRVAIWINNDSKFQYTGVLKDYTDGFIELMDVDYANDWTVIMERGHSTKHERGLILRKDGNDIVIQSKSPFKVTLRHMFWREDKPNAERKNINKTIEPFGEIRFNIMPPGSEVGVTPFKKLRFPESYHYQNYKKIFFEFHSVRTADIVLAKNYGIIRHRTEKYEAKLLDFGALADAMLTGKGGEIALDESQADTPLIIHNGFLTNLPRERMDFAEVDKQISQRWEASNYFRTLDKKLRPIRSHYFLGLFPFLKARKILSLIRLMITLNSDNKERNNPIRPLVTSMLCYANRTRRRNAYKEQVLIKKKRRPFKVIVSNCPRFWTKIRLKLKMPRKNRTVPVEE